MAARFDIAALDESGQITVLVEAKSKLGTDATWARELRRLIAERAPAVVSGMFPLVTPDALYLWPAGGRLDSLPATLDAATLLGKHLDRVGARRDRAMVTLTPNVICHPIRWRRIGETLNASLPGIAMLLAPVCMRLACQPSHRFWNTCRA